MTYIIYGAPGSGSGIIEAACAELGVAYETRDLDARNDEHRRDGYAALNPHRKMPTLETPEGEIITESVAILLALDERHRDVALLPPPASPARAQALRWMLFLATELYPLVELIDYPERFTPTADDAPAVRARADALTRERWQILERHIAGTPYCLPSGFSATDLYITKLAVWLDRDWRAIDLPKVDALTAAVLARPALATVWARHVRPASYPAHAPRP